MKKKVISSLIILAVLAAAGVCYYQLGQTSFDRAFQGYAVLPPAEAEASIGLLVEGTYPGLSDTPITWEQARPSRQTLQALRNHRYLPLPPLASPPDGGIDISQADGCSPVYLAYWDGVLLWLPAANSERWRPFLPLPPHSLGEELNTIYNLLRK